MTLFIDADSKKLVQSETSERAVPSPVFMQGDNEPLVVRLLEKAEGVYAERTLVPRRDFLKVAIARFKGYPKLLTFADSYAINEGGHAEITLPLNTVNIEQALGDSESVPAYLEVEYSTSDGKIVTVLQTTCTVKNDLIDGSPAAELQDRFYDKPQIDAMLTAVYDEQDNPLPEKGKWITVKVADGVYTQKFVGIEE
ncbi:MAG: hypothetical protein J6P03_02210 [Opitutales bacterium]|nr:hypothetical protein [Opitutales bacterium]